MSVIEQVAEAQDRMLRGVEAAQEQVIEVNRRIAETMVNVLPDGDRFTAPSLPGVENLPRPDEFIDRYFDFTAKMAEANRSFYKEMVAVWVPAEQNDASTAPKSTAPKSTASKRTAEKASKRTAKQSKKTA